MLLTFAYGVGSSPVGLACPAAEFREVTRNSLDGAESSSSVPESITTFSLVSDTVL